MPQLMVLVVDDVRANRMVLEAMLAKMGYGTLTAESGEQAIVLCAERQPDIILMDVMMPGMNGYDTVREIRSSASRWIPVIFISAMNRNEDIVEGIHAGGDDYLFKPVNYEVLRAKIHALQERLNMMRLLVEQNQTLLDYQERSREEGIEALEFMQRLTALDKLSDPAVQFYMKPAENFSGDLIAVARTPANDLHVLLADSTGHGLTAALAVTPILQPFYSMTAKGYGLQSIAAEVNRKIKEYLPVHRFVAAIFLCLDGEGNLSVWNGGCPPAIVLNDAGEQLYQFSSKHLPLGILPSTDFDDRMEYFNTNVQHCQVMLYSDGAMDGASVEGGASGVNALVRAVQSAERVEGRLESLKTFLGAQSQLDTVKDDIALLLVDCLQSSSTREQVAGRSHEHIASFYRIEEEARSKADSWYFELRLAAEQLRTVDSIPLLLHVANHVEGLSQEQSGKLFMIIAELFNNALDHGLLKLDSKLKQDPLEGIEHYYEERAQRLERLADGEIVIRMEHHTASSPYLKVVLRDTGDGFDWHSLKDETSLSAQARRHGRGIALIRSMGCEIQFVGTGSEVHVYMQLGN
jgi:CheY-like chemotaxis protein/anti-sigma regulatory factor (Ser/Thr protein kinase)